MDHQWMFPIRLDHNYDGDTFDLEIDLGFSIKIYKSVRLAGVDTPELRGGTPETKALARFARDHAEWYIRYANKVFFKSTVWSGKYGRPVGDLICDGNSLADYLVAEGLAVPYDGGSRAELQAQHQKNAEILIEKGRISVEG